MRRRSLAAPALGRTVRVLALCVVAAPAALAQPLDPVPTTYLPGGAGAEGCAPQWSTRSAIRAHSAPTAASAHIRTVAPDRRIDANDYDESIRAVLRPGRLRVGRAVTFRGTRLGDPESVTRAFAPGDEIELTSYAEEGAVYLSLGGRVYGGFIDGLGASGAVEVVTEPVVEVWVRLIRHGSDRPAAWVNTAQAGLARRAAACL